MAYNNPSSGYPYQKIVGSSGQPPVQQSYPRQANASSYPTQTYHQPPYNQQYPQAYPQAVPAPQPGYSQYSPAYGQPAYGQAPPPYPGAPANTGIAQPMVLGQFDSGARFGIGGSVNVPPPPPGVMPNAAQVAASRGQPVAMQQQKAGWLEGGSGGGYTFW